MARAIGLHGRTRTVGSSQERARVAVQKAIAGALDRIESLDGGLGRHLRSGVSTGLLCSYEPPADDDAVDWVLD